jgi:hypothetical protein
MTTQRIVAAALAVIMALGAAPALAQQTTGAVGGKATDEAKKPYSDYVVQLRDVASGQVADTRPLDLEGKFGFASVGVPQTYLVELVKVKDKKIVCTEGPYALTVAVPNKLDVNISCGKAPAALWLLLAGAATTVAIVTRSTSK